jgi:hypothetical protein
MKLKNILGYYDYIFIFISLIVFVFGSTERYQNYTLPISIASILLLFGFWLIRGKKIEIPKNYILYLVFIGLLLVLYFVFGGEINYFLLFLSGGLYWLSIYNLRDFVSKYFLTFLITFGFAMAGVYIVSMARGVYFSSSNDLFLPIASGVLHNHLGDLWAIILVGAFYKILQKYEWWQIPLAIFGIVLIAQSYSRSAIVALVVGSLYVYYKSDKKKEMKKIFEISLVIATLLFLFFSAFKTTLFSRPYYLEGLNSFIKSPLGTGMGNFSKVSPESSLAHNIILEILSGIGIFSAVFIVWLIKVFKSFTTGNSSILYKALFLAIFVNFFFDTTYIIPAMVWIWFSTLALAFT